MVAITDTDSTPSREPRLVELEMASEVGILLVDEAGDLQFVAASDERAHLLELFQVQNQEGPCQDWFSTGVPVSVDDLEAVTPAQLAPRAVSAGSRSAQFHRDARRRTCGFMRRRGRCSGGP